MTRLSFHVAGESHGPGLAAVLTGLPAGIPFDREKMARWLRLRRTAEGRGPRSAAEDDRFEILSGITHDRTNGGPLAILVRNRDRSGGSRTPENVSQPITFPRPGHADLAGALKWGLDDASTVAELASARLTAAYTALGAVCSTFLDVLGIHLLARVTRIGTAGTRRRSWRKGVRLPPLVAKAEDSPVLSLSPAAGRAFAARMDAARAAGDTLGGEFEIVAAPVPPGLGGCQPLHERLDSRAAALIMGIPAVRAVAVGAGFEAAAMPGSAFHDPISGSPGRGFLRGSNRAGGIEGGMTNGEPVVVRAVVKPIPSLGKPLPSASLDTGKPGPAARIRADVCAVPAAAIVARALLAFLLADAVLARTGGEVCHEVQERLRT